jgi:hypothetical protein
VASVLNAEGFDVTVSRPGRSVRVTSERHRHDLIEIALRSDVDPPEVVCRISRARGSRTIEEEEAIRRGAAPEELDEEDVLSCLLRALSPWLER